MSLGRESVSAFWPETEVRRVVAEALHEDLVGGDLSTEAAVPPGRTAEAVLVAKADGVVAGLPVLPVCLALLGAAVDLAFAMEEGEVRKGQVVARLRGPARPILAAERVAVSLMQHLSGVATLTAAYVRAVAGTRTRIVDTRKTTPGLRSLERIAVRVGGGVNHRLGLGAGILLKENHLRLAGGVRQAIQAARRLAGPSLRLEVEVENLTELEEAVAAGADLILLDNFSRQAIAEATALVAGRVPLEVSGGVSLELAAEAARLGVDYVSVGRLTHSAPALDLALEVYGT